MSFGGSTSNYPAAPAQPLGIPDDRMPSMESDQPWPWMCGTRPLPLILLSERFNVRIEPVSQDTKKDSVEVGKNFFVDQVAGLCLGLQGEGRLALQQLKIDEEVIWDGPLFWNGTNERDTITVEGRGEIDIVWGTETQGIHPDLAAFGHPAYRGKVLLVFRGFFCGYQQEQLPAVVAVFSRWPAFDYCPESNIEGDCNAAACFGDLFTHPRVGLRWPETRLDTNNLATLAERLAADCLGLSPLVDSNETLQSVLAQFDEHLGGFTVPSADGRFAYGLMREWPADEPVQTIDESHLLEEPEEDPQPANETKTAVDVVFTNRDYYYKKDYVPWTDPANYAARAENRREQLDRSWFTRAAAAQLYAAIVGPAKALKDQRGTLRTRLDAVDGIELGGLFRHSYGHTDLCGLPLRCVELAYPGPEKPEASIGYRLDRGHLVAQHVVPGDLVSPSQPTYQPEPITAQRILELPGGQGYAQTEQRLLVLASRPTVTTTTIRAWLQKPGGSYAAIAAGSAARHGTLSAEYSANTLLIDRGVGLVVQLDGVDTTLPSISAADAQANEWLAFIGDEILSVFGAILLAPGQYRLKAIRGRFDTERETHSAGAEVFITRLSALISAGIYDQRSIATLKVQPVAIGGALDLAEVDAETLSLTRRNLRPLRPLNLRLNDQLAGATWSTGGDVTVSWSPVPDYKATFWAISTSDLPATQLVILDATGALAGIKDVPAGTASYTLTNAELLADLGTEQDFTVEAYQIRDGRRSLLSATRTIEFV